MELGATRIVNAKDTDVLKFVEELTGGAGIEKVFETAGSPVTIAQTPYLVKNGGTITLVGLSANPEITFNFGQIMAKEARIESVFRYRNLYKKAIAAAANGLDIGRIATHEFDFANIQEAYEAAIKDKENIVKAVIKL
jgi:L-iditol 2-dehydrogenase